MTGGKREAAELPLLEGNGTKMQLCPQVADKTHMTENRKKR